MTKIYYSPYYRGAVYAGLSEERDVIVDEMTVDDGGLVRQLQMMLGIHHEEQSSAERLTVYYKGLKRWMEAHQENELYEPFKLSGMDVARRCLEWRDELAMCGWSDKNSATSDRMKALRGAEEYFEGGRKAPSRAEYVKEIEEAMRGMSAQWAVGVTIVMPCGVEMLHPAIGRLVRMMGEKGAVIEVKGYCKGSSETNLEKVRELLCGDDNSRIYLERNDHSFVMYDFENERMAAQYMAVMAGKRVGSVWINSDNKTTDNWLRSLGKPVMGSVTQSTVPQVPQLLMLGISLFERPLNIRSLLDWLQPDVHPLGKRFRKKLSDVISSEGGYHNEECRRVIEEYVEGEEKKEREGLVRMYLPHEERRDVEEEMVDVGELREFVGHVEAWAKKRAKMMGEEADNELWVAQLCSLADMAHAMLLLLEDVETGTIGYRQVENWAGALFRSERYVQNRAEKGCQYYISSPGCMTGMAKETVWWNMDGDENYDLCCQFLMPSERRVLEEEIEFWDADEESQLRQRAMLTPLTHTEGRLVLAYCETRGGKATQKHPLIVRIENLVTNWSDYVERPDVRKEEDVEWEEVESTCNEAEAESKEIRFSNTDWVKWPEYLSPTAVDTLIQWPLDYVMDHILNLHETGPGTLPDVRVTKGQVAHAVIERLFAPRREGEKVKAEVIRQRIEAEYDDVYREMVDMHGAILYLPEYQLEERLLKSQLTTSLQHLVEIIEANVLRVTGCERRVEGYLGVLGKERGVNDVVGYIDMTLEDGGHHPVVFDFKWTSSKKYYQDLLANNESIQLQLYRHMLGGECRDEVSRVGYYLMPRARLYSTEDFVGDYCVKVDCEERDGLVEKIRKSVEYRRRQIENGVIENGDNLALSSLDYCSEDGYNERVPLKENDDGAHWGNKFSDYVLFKKH